MEPNDPKKPKITENPDYDENGEYDPSLTPEQRAEVLKTFHRILTDELGDKALPYATALGEHWRLGGCFR